MKRGLLLAILFLLIPFLNSNGQTADLKQTFIEAESYFLFEEYNEALPLYLKLRRADPTNNNVNFKIGRCFLNDPYQKDKSIFYLEEASKDINPKYKINNFRETSAPLETFFYLGHAYLINNDIDNAIINYKYFLNVLDEKIYDVDLVKEQIKICENARELLKLPVDYDYKILSEAINSRFADINPILSGDGKKIVYVSKRAFYDATFYSESINGVWQPPRNIIPELGVDRDVYPTSLSWDGKKMIIYRNDDFIGNLYQSEYIDGSWTNMVKLGDNISTKYWESHGSFSKDGKTLYFTSNRKGGFGGLDIYKSYLKEDGTWGTPINLGKEINTRYNEETPFITENGKILYFSSYGHYNMGGYDVFYSNLDKDGNWGTPINMGYPINTTDDDLFFYPVDNGTNAYYSQFLDDGYGRHDIYYLSVYSEDNPRMYLITGSLKSDKGKISDKDGLTLYLVDERTGDTVQIGKPDLRTQSFELKAKKGEYDLIFNSLTFNDLVTKIKINEQTEKSGILFEEKLELETKPYVPQLLQGSDSRVFVEDSIVIAKPGKKTKIPLKLSENSTLIATHYLDTIILSADSFIIDKNEFVFEFTPENGLNTIDFILIEENKDKSLKTISIVAGAEIGEKQDTISIVDTKFPPKESLVKEGNTDSLNLNYQKELKRLSNFAEEDLKRLIDDTDLKKNPISSTDDLIKYLESQDIDNEDIIDIVVIAKVNNSQEELLLRLIGNSHGDMLKYLQDIDPEYLELTTASELIAYIKENGTANDHSIEEINLLLENISKSPTDQESVLNELSSYAKSDLLDYIVRMNLDSLGIYSPTELFNHLIDHAGQEFEAKLLIATMSDILKDPSPEEFRIFLVKNSPEKLADLIMNLDLEKESIYTSSELVSFILENRKKLGMSEVELDMLVLKQLADYRNSPILDSDPMMQSKKGLSKAAKTSGLILITGILIFIIFYLRRKKKEER